MTRRTRYRKCKQCKRLTLPDEFNKGDNIAYASIPIGAYSEQRIIPSKIAVETIPR